MLKLKKYIPLTLVFLGATNLHQVSLAQFPPAFPYVSPPVPSHNIMFPRRDRSVDQETETDTSIQEDSGENGYTPNPSAAKKYHLDSDDKFSFTNQDDPRVAAGQYENFGGTFSGKYKVSMFLGLPVKGTLTLEQNGHQVTGTLTGLQGRQGEVIGTVQGAQLVGTLTFKDNCSGEGSFIADLSPDGDLMTGKYKVRDCDGKYSGSYKLKRL